MKQLLVISAGGPSTSATNWASLGSGATDGWFGTDANRRSLIPVRGIIRNMYIESDTPPGAGKSYAFTFRINGVSSAVTATISDAATTASDIVNSATVAAGDEVNIQCVPTGTPTGALVKIAVEFEPSTPQRFVINGGSASNLATAGAREYNFLFSSPGNTFSGTQNLRAMVVPMACTIKNLYVKLSGSPTAGKSYEFSIYRNGVQEATSVFTVADTATTGSAENIAIACSPGDTLSFSSISAGTPTARRASWGATFQPSIDGTFVLSATTSNMTAAQYNSLQGVSSSSATEASREELIVGPFSTTLSKLYVSVNTAPGAGTTRVFTLRKNAGSGALTATISGTNTTANDTTNSVSFASGDDAAMLNTVTGVPAAFGSVRWAVVATSPVTQSGNFFQAFY